MGRVAFKFYDCFIEDYLVVLPLINNNRKKNIILLFLRRE